MGADSASYVSTSESMLGPFAHINAGASFRSGAGSALHFPTWRRAKQRSAHSLIQVSARLELL